MKRIYADWAATAPLSQEAALAIEAFSGPENITVNANANSLHTEGRRAFAAMEDARSAIARSTGARPDEVIFTSGATEADNAAIFGIVGAAAQTVRQRGQADFVPHLIVSSIEHDAVLQPAHRLESEGVEVTYVEPDRRGIISPASIESALQPNTVLVSIMLANNEVGSIQPVAEIAKVVHAAGALMHTDAVQAFGKMSVGLDALGVDALSISAHKIGGPKGIGALVLKSGTPFLPVLLGGGQEHGLRSGTQNVAGMVGFAAAATAATGEGLNEEVNRQRNLRDMLYEGLCAFEGVQCSVPCESGSKDFLPNIVSVNVAGLESETLILRFDREGVALAGGSACSSHSLEPSRVLKQIGIDRDRALCTLRISIGRSTTEEDVHGILAAFERVLSWQR
ncbi:cysteine desulfurase family protein [Cryptobacterium curtum]|uniref:cysteine desulfurase family protein n=1 Tax=Cryptobacterium curtum TaxID=84163 RepID=UPI00248E5BA5|nr:cysteine desulfurase family protein [Cryptobacterium curtum]